jgi:septal ring factor EnvC (AmiA/AmiB activator)
MDVITDLLKIAQQQREVAIFIGLAALVLLLLVVMFVKSLRRPTPAAAKTAPLARAAAPVAVAQTLEKLQTVSAEGHQVLARLQEEISEKDRLISEKRKYIDDLAKQEADLQAHIRQAEATPIGTVEQRHQRQLRALEDKLIGAKRARFWGGVMLGWLLALLMGGGYLAYLRYAKQVDLSALLQL